MLSVMIATPCTSPCWTDHLIYQRVDPWPPLKQTSQLLLIYGSLSPYVQVYRSLCIRQIDFGAHILCCIAFIYCLVPGIKADIFPRVYCVSSVWMFLFSQTRAYLSATSQNANRCRFIIVWCCYWMSFASEYYEQFY